MIVTKCHVTYEFQSTHPVRGATACRYPLAYLVAISIHAPREGCDYSYRGHEYTVYEFQSTHPVRGATPPIYSCRDASGFQSTHPVRGATTETTIRTNTQTVFQSTHPVRGATHITITNNGTQIISIHAPREGCDRTRAVNGNDTANFNPRTP